MIGDPGRDRFHRRAAAVPGEGIGIAGIDHQRTRRAQRNGVPAPFDFGRGASALRRNAGDGGARVQFDIGQVAAVPRLVPGARRAQRHAVNGWQEGEG